MFLPKQFRRRLKTLVLSMLCVAMLPLLEDASAMGIATKIEGTLVDKGLLFPPPEGVVGERFGLSRNRCVLYAKSITGTGAAKAISYNSNNLGCYTFRIVDDVVTAPTYWCSQYVFPSNGSELGGDECVVQTGGGSGGEGLLVWEPEPFKMPSSGFCGGGPSYSEYQDFKIVVRCGHAPSNSESGGW